MQNSALSRGLQDLDPQCRMPRSMWHSSLLARDLLQPLCAPATSEGVQTFMVCPCCMLLLLMTIGMRGLYTRSDVLPCLFWSISCNLALLCRPFHSTCRSKLDYVLMKSRNSAHQFEVKLPIVESRKR
eukprot:1278318-Amphidinium_carterae.1